MRLGISSFTYKWSFGIPGYPSAKNPLDAEKLIQRACDLGVDLVQLGDNIPLHTETERELSKLKGAADERGIILEIGTTGTEPGGLMSYLEIARQLGAGLIRTIVGTRQKADDPKTAESNLRQVVEAYEEAGVFLALENYELYSVHQLAKLIGKLGSPMIGACLDTTNSLGILETPDIVLEALAPHAVCLHVKDIRFTRVDYGLGFSVQGCPVGEGLLDVTKIVERVRSFGRTDSVVLEQWTPYQGSVEETVALQDRWAEKSLQYLKPIVTEP